MAIHTANIWTTYNSVALPWLAAHCGRDADIVATISQMDPCVCGTLGVPFHHLVRRVLRLRVLVVDVVQVNVRPYDRGAPPRSDAQPHAAEVKFRRVYAEATGSTRAGGITHARGALGGDLDVGGGGVGEELSELPLLHPLCKNSDGPTPQRFG